MLDGVRVRCRSVTLALHSDPTVLHSSLTCLILTETVRTTADLVNSEMSPLFQAVAEATEEAIYNSLLQAVDVTGFGGTIKALPRDKIKNLVQ